MNKDGKFPKNSNKKRRTFPAKGSEQKNAGEDDDDVKDEKVEIDPAKLAKYTYDEGKPKYKSFRNAYAGQHVKQRKQKMDKSVEQLARSELLLQEDAGYIEPDNNEPTYSVSQRELLEHVDITTATKHFSLSLREYGPYRSRYSRNGRHLLLGGHRGHIAAIDWVTKKLHTETNVMESVRDVSWLHTETMFAVAQRRWTFIYDNQGVELHCLKSLYQTRRLDFLPYHFLLVAATDTSFVHWLDVSTGSLVKSTRTREGKLDVLCHNPTNAIVHTAHHSGVVNLWSPNESEPLVKMLCHPCPVRGCAVDDTGRYMATTGMDTKLRIWDLRQYRMLSQTPQPLGVGHVAWSQRGALAVSTAARVVVYNKAAQVAPTTPYMMHDCDADAIGQVQFCPFEDVLGVAHQGGFTSLIIPGSGEPNMDALEANPFQSTKQRREAEVKALLDKIQPDMITLDTSAIAKVDEKSLDDKLEDRAKILYLKPQQVQFTPKYKKKGRSSAGHKMKRIQQVRGANRKKQIEQVKKVAAELLPQAGNKGNKKPQLTSVLDRFAAKS